VKQITHYSNRYEPAMPVLEVHLGLDRQETPIVLEALVDSGLIPQAYLQTLGAKPVQERWLRGVTGGRQLVRLYTVFIQIGAFGTYAPVIGGQNTAEVILGRDILNQLVVTLDGLSQTTFVQSE
jgi:hypothetical protein